jgi:tetratricopeptide (TPR) repeat protein
VPASRGQDDSSNNKAQVDKANAYYHFALGHLYAELASAYGNKGNFVDKAIDNYREAMKADPEAGFLTEELSDLYVQAGRLREAVLDAEAALRADPNDLNARRILARIYTRLIGDSRQQRVSEEMVQKAVEQYEKIAEIDPADAEVWLMLGRLYKLTQDSLKSEDAYKKALEIDETNEDALVGLAMVYSDLGDQPRAAEVLRKVISSNPSVRTLTFLAGTYESIHEYAKAAETYQRALELASNNADIKRAYAQNLLMAGKTEEALEVYEQLAVEQPEDFESNLRRSQIYRDSGNLARAREALDAAKEVSPDNLEVQYNDVNLLEAEGRTDEAMAALQGILKSTERDSYSSAEEANRAIFLERLGLMYRSVNQTEEAVETFRQMAKLDPDKGARVSAQIADTYRQAKQFDRAYKEIEEAHSKYPEDRMVGIIRATILADSGRREQAIEAVQDLTAGKKDRESYLTEAQIYDKTKSYDLMATAIEEALKLSESDDEKATVLFMRGAMYERQKRFEEAEATFREVLEINPDNPSAMNYLGYMWADRNENLDEALKMITRALEFEPNNGAYLDSLGWVYYRLGRLEEAEENLQRASRLVSGDPVVHDHLGDVYFSLGRLPDAISAWKLSLKEWSASPAGEKDPPQIEAIEKKLEGAEVQLARESTANQPKRP